MGDKHDTIYRIVTAAYVLEQARAIGCFSVDDRAKKNFSFSHLYTALTYPEFREFVGMKPADRQRDLSKSRSRRSGVPSYASCCFGSTDRNRNASSRSFGVRTPT
jgi:hypothetical protein